MNPLTAEILWSLYLAISPTVAISTIIAQATSYNSGKNEGATVLFRVNRDSLSPLTSSTGFEHGFTHSVQGIDARLMYFPDEKYWTLKPRKLPLLASRSLELVKPILGGIGMASRALCA